MLKLTVLYNSFLWPVMMVNDSWNCLSSFVCFYCCNRHHNQLQLGKKKVLFQFIVYNPTWEHQDRNLEGETEEEALEKQCLLDNSCLVGSAFLLKKACVVNYVCVCVWVCAHERSRRPKPLITPRLELQAMVSYLISVLRTKLGPF